MINSGLEENPVDAGDRIPSWGWGEVKGPYEAVGSLLKEKD